MKNTTESNEHKRMDGDSQFCPKINIIDDDAVVTKVLALHMKAMYPNAVVTYSNTPTVEAGCDVYFVDDDFGGEKLAYSLLREIRELSPHALIVALSSRLDFETLRKMVNMGCCAVYDKGSHATSAEASEVIDRYLSELEFRQRSVIRRSSFHSILLSMKELLSTWNQCLKSAERSEVFSLGK